jgi:hypothetical protein
MAFFGEFIPEMELEKTPPLSGLLAAVAKAGKKGSRSQPAFHADPDGSIF